MRAWRGEPGCRVRVTVSGEGWPGLGMGTRLGCRAGPAVHVRADASQRAQARSPGLGGVVLIGAESLQAPWPAYQPHAPHSHTYGESRLAHIVCGMSGQGWGRRGARVAASSAHEGRTSDCGATSVGIVYVLRSSSPLKVPARPAAPV